MGVWKLSSYRVLTNEQEGIKGIKSETRNPAHSIHHSRKQFLTTLLHNNDVI
jgi:hypothetical protein